MNPKNPTPKEQQDFAILERANVQKIKNGYLVKIGIEWTFCADLQSVLAYMKCHFEPTPKLEVKCKS